VNPIRVPISSISALVGSLSTTKMTRPTLERSSRSHSSNFGPATQLHHSQSSVWPSTSRRRKRNGEEIPGQMVALIHADRPANCRKRADGDSRRVPPLTHACGDPDSAPACGPRCVLASAREVCPYQHTSGKTPYHRRCGRMSSKRAIAWVPYGNTPTKQNKYGKNSNPPNNPQIN
jgi:hypothetical protein